jgi:enediyne biosynthesis protein E4
MASACGSPPDTRDSKAQTTAQPWFTDEAQAAGLSFVHENGMSGRRYIAEIMAPGAALVDFDNDGDLDMYIVQGQKLGAASAHADGETVSSGSRSRADRLFRNDLRSGADGRPLLHFTDVTPQAGIDLQTYGMGVATGDIDNDGWTDLLVTRLSGTVLLRNNGNGTFSDVTAKAGLASSTWSVPASFFDFDRDGWLDLYVGNYIRYSTESDVGCFALTGAPDYCRPQNFPTVPGRLYRNQRNGTFADVTVAAGLSREFGPALGSIAFDANGDGWPDLYVANDGSDNQLWMNRRNGTFENRAVIGGVAVNGAGKAEGSMGVDAADYDGDGDEDLIITNLTGEGMTLYANDGSGLFSDVAAMAGLRSATLRYTGFGASWIDVDNDGALDVLTVNGAVQTIHALARAGDRFPLKQQKQLFRNTRDRRFADVTSQAGEVFQIAEVSRGAAFGDVDNDGDTDVVVANNNGPLRLLINQLGNREPWLGVRVTGPRGRDMPGAKITLLRQDGTGPMRHAHADGSYASANDPRVLFGLGDGKGVTRIRVQWPDGRVEEWPVDSLNQWMTLKQGSGRALP